MQPRMQSGDRVVLDTNIVLDLFVFNDAAALPLKEALQAGTLQWIVTSSMRDELERVLGYPQIVTRLNFYGRTVADVLADFDRHARLASAAEKAPVTCSDADDQVFIDLAVAHKAWLLSKDQAVLSMAKRLSPLNVRVQCAINKIAN
jgi:putative PIN family toxin of toxin-antitoxin system